MVTFRAGVEEEPKQIKSRVIKLFELVKKQYSDVIEASDTVQLDPASLTHVVGALQQYALTECERDAVGEAFEIFIGPSLKGPQGQFFTPRNVVKMVVDMVDPKPDEKIIDPACGSGGFLVEALRHVWRTVEERGQALSWPELEIHSEKQKVPSISFEALTATHHCLTIGEMVENGLLSAETGDEIGKAAYGTGDIPFVRTSDFANWEINHNPKQGVSEEIYAEYADGEDIQENDILLVRDGTYLVGSSCIITKEDVKSLFCGGLFKFRVQGGNLDPFLFLGLMNSYIVKRQMRTKQFTRDVIDTLGNRIEEVVLPIPKSTELRKSISDAVRGVVQSRVQARDTITRLTLAIAPD